MFLAPGLAARPLAQYARALREAMRGSALGPLESFILRMGEDRLVVREVDAGRGAAALLVAGGGPVDRLGLARLELERAVTRLGAR
jgi:predicted regulator of Ras-like GTPase activity (Roadblock/LC7/MglB family)